MIGSEIGLANQVSERCKNQLRVGRGLGDLVDQPADERPVGHCQRSPRGGSSKTDGHANRKAAPAARRRHAAAGRLGRRERVTPANRSADDQTFKHARQGDIARSDEPVDERAGRRDGRSPRRSPPARPPHSASARPRRDRASASAAASPAPMPPAPTPPASAPSAASASADCGLACDAGASQSARPPRNPAIAPPVAPALAAPAHRRAIVRRASSSRSRISASDEGASSGNGARVRNVPAGVTHHREGGGVIGPALHESNGLSRAERMQTLRRLLARRPARRRRLR